jgi:hypothetical protein
VYQWERIRRVSSLRKPSLCSRYITGSSALCVCRGLLVETKDIPAIVMKGTTPVLYEFEITVRQVEAVQTSQYLPKVTKV